MNTQCVWKFLFLQTWKIFKNIIAVHCINAPGSEGGGHIAFCIQNSHIIMVKKVHGVDRISCVPSQVSVG